MEEESNSQGSLSQASHSRNGEERSYDPGSPVGDIIEERSKRLKSAENEDRISALHDSLIHHILSFLPLAEDVIKTSVLSKRWQYVWTHTPNLTFGLGDIFNSVKRFADFVDKTLIQYASSKIKKFAIDIDHNGRWFRDLHTQIESWIRFATSHEVEKLALEFFEYDDWDYYVLPQFLYENHCLTELKTSRCDFEPNGKVDWRSLKVLCIYCANMTDEVVENILSGSPMLESLELDWCTRIHRIDISSKCLKRLVINGVGDINDGDDKDESKLKISGPYLENLEILGGWGRRRCRLKNLSSLVSATLDFYLEVDKERGNNFYKYVKYQNLVKQLLKKVHHVKELKVGNWCIQVLSILEVKGLPSPLSNRKCLILNIYDFENWHLPGIASLLCSSPELEKLIMECRDTSLQFNFDRRFAKSYDFGDNYWASLKQIFHCLLVHLKKVEIFDFDASSNEYQFVLDFVEFLLKNARVLEKMIIFDASHEHHQSGREKLLVVTEKLLSFPRSSPHAVVLLSN